LVSNNYAATIYLGLIERADMFFSKPSHAKDPSFFEEEYQELLKRDITKAEDRDAAIIVRISTVQ